MKKKRLVVLTLATTMALSMSACGGSDTATTTADTTAVTASSEIAKDVDTSEVATEGNTTEGTTTSKEDLAKELILGLSKITENHKDETMSFDISMVAEFAYPMTDGSTIPMKVDMNGSAKYSTSVYYMNLVSKADLGEQYGGVQKNVTEVYRLKTDTESLEYAKNETDGKWYKTKIADESIINPISTIDMYQFGDYELTENDTDYILTADTDTSKFNNTFTDMANSSGAGAKVKIIINFDKATKEFKDMTFVFDNIANAGIELNNTELKLVNQGFSKDKFEIPAEIIENAIDNPLGEDGNITVIGDGDAENVTDDKTTATLIGKAAETAMANEEAFGEVYQYNGTVCRINEMGKISPEQELLNSIGKDTSTFIKEVEANLGNANLTIQNKDGVFDHWIITKDISNKFTISIADTDETVVRELYTK